MIDKYKKEIFQDIYMAIINDDADRLGRILNDFGLKGEEGAIEFFANSSNAHMVTKRILSSAGAAVCGGRLSEKTVKLIIARSCNLVSIPRLAELISLALTERSEAASRNEAPMATREAYGGQVSSDDMVAIIDKMSRSEFVAMLRSIANQECRTFSDWNYKYATIMHVYNRKIIKIDTLLFCMVSSIVANPIVN